MASTYLSRTLVTPTSTTQYTFSAWVKRTTTVGASSANEVIFSNWYSTSLVGYIRFEDQTDTLHIYDNADGTQKLNYRTTASYRDTNAWYHIVVNADTSRSSGDRCRLYVNGEQVSLTKVSDSTGRLGMLSGDSTNGMRLGAINNTGGTEYYLGGLMSHVHFIDGGIYEASDFGEYDANGVWKIKTSPSVTYGTNGFFILKDGNSVTDQSGNGNNFTVAGGTLTNTEDSPSNVFCTLNPLIPSNGSFSEGNNTVTTSSSSWCTVGSNLGVTSGKYYWEVKINLLSGSTTSFYTMIGFARLQGSSSDLGSNLTSNLGDNNGVGIYSDNGTLYHPGGTVSYANSFKTSGTIIGVALDLDNNYGYWSINGTWQNSGDPESGATGTGGYDLSSFADGSFIVPASSVQNYASANQSENEYNFGNGYFGTTAVASAGTNASGNGIFEYDVPTGYTALSTKGLNL